MVKAELYLTFKIDNFNTLLQKRWQVAGENLKQVARIIQVTANFNAGESYGYKF